MVQLAQLGSNQTLELAGVRVLIIEDEYFIGDDLRRALDRSGASVIGPCATLAQAHAAVDAGGFDCAVVDLNLHGESGISIAEQLATEERPFVIATGYGSPAVPKTLAAVPRIEKPFDPDKILQLLGELKLRGTTGLGRN